MWKFALGFILCISLGLANEEPSLGRQQFLNDLLLHDCGACHGLTLQGGLGSPLTPAALSGKSDEWLINTILEGRADTAMPPWKTFLSVVDAAWIVKKLRNPD